MARSGVPADEQNRIRSRSRVRSLATAVLATALVGAADPARAVSMSEVGEEAAEIGSAVFDVAILRPLNFAALAVGSVFFVASAPFVAPSDDGLEQAWDVFVYAPYEYTFARDIGDF